MYNFIFPISDFSFKFTMCTKKYLQSIYLFPLSLSWSDPIKADSMDSGSQFNKLKRLKCVFALQSLSWEACIALIGFDKMSQRNLTQNQQNVRFTIMWPLLLNPSGPLNLKSQLKYPGLGGLNDDSVQISPPCSCHHLRSSHFYVDFLNNIWRIKASRFSEACFYWRKIHKLCHAPSKTSTNLFIHPFCLLFSLDLKHAISLPSFKHKEDTLLWIFAMKDA